MKILNIYREINGEAVKVHTQSYHDRDKEFSIIWCAVGQQRNTDILKLGYHAEINTDNINSLYQHNGIWSTWDTLLSDRIICEEATAVSVETGEMETIRLAFEIYSQGYVMKIKTSHGGFFGNGGTFYLKRIGNRSASAGSLKEAIKFRFLSDFRRYVINHKSDMKNLAEKGWKFDLDYHNDIFREEVMEKRKIMSPAVLEKEQGIMEDIEELLLEINKCQKQEPGALRPIPESLGDDPNASIRKEIEYRMLVLQFDEPVIDNFKDSGRIYMSEFFGIIYDLNAEAKKAVEEVREMGLHPYHVIRSHFEFGDVYDVLYVSEDTEEWSYERINSEGYLDIWSMGEFKEHGPIKIKKINGGLQRVA